MKDVSGQSFRYGGKSYVFTLIMYSNDEKYKVVLDNKAMPYFEFSTELNGIIHEGSFEYIDDYGRVDRLFEQQGAYCELVFTENEEKRDGQMSIEKLSDTNRIYENFMVQNIGIIERIDTKIRYKIDIASNNVYKCIKTIDFSNYALAPQPVFDIVKQCFASAGFSIDRESFGKVRSSVRLNYATNGNDNVLTAIKYLFNKFYYYEQKDDSLKYIFYNETTDKIQVCDLKNKETMTGSYSVIISLMKSKRENLIVAEPTNLASVTRFPASENMKSIFNYQVFDYDYNLNSFTDKSITSKNIANYINQTYDSETKLIPKQKPLDDDMYTRRASYWNNQIDIYGEAAKMLAKNNALLIETDGEILRKPAALINVCIDRDTSEVTDENKDTLKDLMTRYRGLEGMWLTSRVHHWIYPQTGRFKQALTLVRNYTVDLENQDK